MLLATALTPTLASGLKEAAARRNHRADPGSEDSCNTRLSDPSVRGQTSPAPFSRCSPFGSKVRSQAAAHSSGCGPGNRL